MVSLGYLGLVYKGSIRCIDRPGFLPQTAVLGLGFRVELGFSKGLGFRVELGFIKG